MNNRKINEEYLNYLISKNIYESLVYKRPLITENMVDEDLDELKRSTLRKFNPFSDEFFMRDKGKNNFWTDKASSRFDKPRRMRGLNDKQLSTDAEEYNGYNSYLDRAEKNNVGIKGNWGEGESVSQKVDHLKLVQAKVRGYFESGKYFGTDAATTRIVKNFLRACWTARGVMTSMYNRNRGNSEYEANRERYAQMSAKRGSKSVRETARLSKCLKWLSDDVKMGKLSNITKGNMQSFLLNRVLPNSNLRSQIPPEYQKKIEQFLGTKAYNDAIASDKSLERGTGTLNESLDEKWWQGWFTNSRNTSKGGGSVNTTVGNHGAKRIFKPTHEGSGKWVLDLRTEVYSMLQHGYFNRKKDGLNDKQEGILMTWVRDFLKLLDVDYRVWPVGALLTAAGIIIGQPPVDNKPIVDPVTPNVEQTTSKENIAIHEHLGKAHIGTEGLEQIQKACNGKQVLDITVIGYEDTHDGKQWTPAQGKKLAQDRVNDAISQIAQSGIDKKLIKSGGCVVDDPNLRGVVVQITVATTTPLRESRNGMNGGGNLTKAYMDQNNNFVYVFWFPSPSVEEEQQEIESQQQQAGDNGMGKTYTGFADKYASTMKESIDRAIRKAIKSYLYS